MGKRNNPENRGLPKRCRKVRNAFYYDVPKGKEQLWDGKKLFMLGKTETEMYRTLAERGEVNKNVKTIGELLDRYSKEVIPKKSVRSAEENKRQIVILHKVFGSGLLSSIKPQHIYKYFDAKTAKVAAKREIALLSHAYTKAVEWGYISSHPFKGEVRLKGEKPRDRYIEDWELTESLKVAPLFMQIYIEFKLLTGLRKSDILRLKTSDIRDGVLYASTSKNKRAIPFNITPALQAAIDKALALRKVDISPYIFCTSTGESYVKTNGTTSGFDSMWQRFMTKVLKETKVTESFTEHDLRAKAASDSDNDESASKLLGHASVDITKRVYRRKAEIIQPTK